MRFLLSFSGIIFLIFSCTSADDKKNSEEIKEDQMQIQNQTHDQKIYFVYPDSFSVAEKLKLESWINFTSASAQKVLGTYPFDLYYHFHHTDSTGRAVAFGHTARTDSVHAAHFYVDPAYSLEDFNSDWIAPHEISHIAIPRLPKSNLWFYEGFATYMSRQVMLEMGELTKSEVDSINTTRIKTYTDLFMTGSYLPFVADSLIAQHQYPAVYWIGAAFFVEAERILKQENKMNLTDILKSFQSCCHQPDLSIDRMLEHFDEISDSRIFTSLHKLYTTTPCWYIAGEINRR